VLGAGWRVRVSGDGSEVCVRMYAFFLTQKDVRI